MTKELKVQEHKHNSGWIRIQQIKEKQSDSSNYCFITSTPNTFIYIKPEPTSNSETSGQMNKSTIISINSDKEKIRNLLKSQPGLDEYELSEKLNIDIRQVWQLCNELICENKIREINE